LGVTVDEPYLTFGVQLDEPQSSPWTSPVFAVIGQKREYQGWRHRGVATPEDSDLPGLREQILSRAGTDHLVDQTDARFTDHFERGELRRSLRYFRSALREFAPDESIDARLKLIEIYGHWGKAAFREGQFEASARFLKRAVRHAAAFRHALWEDTFRIELAYVRAHQGQFGRARRTIHPVLRPRQEEPGSTGARRFLRVKALLAAAHIAADEGLRDRATRYARRGRKLFMAYPDERLRPHLRLLYGRIAALTPTLANRAAHHFAQAERGFLAFGDGDLPGLSLLSYYRGLLHVQRRDTRAALAEACRSLDLAKRHGFLPARSASLLLKSQLLLQEEVPGADRLYEEVLRDLGSVEDRVVLFKVIANLYLYSWELNEHLELTDSHLRQIHRMADLLDEETFRCLYQRYVALPVARRTLARAFGINPEELGPQEG